MAEQRFRLSGLQKKEIANKVLEYLSHRPVPVSTGSIVTSIDLSFETPEYNVRRTLDKLAEAGAVKRQQDSMGGRHKWTIINKSWDRTNPFKYSHAQQMNDDDDDNEEEELEKASRTVEPVRQEFNYDAKGVDAMLAKRLSEMYTAVGGLGSSHKIMHDMLIKQQETIKALQKELEDRPIPKIIEIRRYDAKPIKIEDEILPKEFPKIIDLANCRRNILLVGPAGAGKSYIAKKVADYLDFEFGSISCSAGMSETHLLGRAVPDLTHGKNRFQTTDFLRTYESGGVFLLDELDAADSNLLLSINTGLANDYISVPNRPDEPRAVKHKDFVAIATANTFGRGANRLYAGRNQLDESTIDRFRMGLVEMDYDKAVETQLCPNVNLRNWCWTVRQKIEASGIRRIMSTRFLIDAQIMTTHGWGLEDIKATYFSGWTAEEKAKVS